MARRRKIALLAGVVGAARTHAVTGNTGGLSRSRGNPVLVPFGGWARQASEGPIVPRKLGNASGGKGPWFGVRSDEPRGGGLA